MGPAAPLNDTYICTQEENGWMFRKLALTGSSPSLFRHSAVAYDGNVIVFGGASANGPQNKIWKLNRERRSWQLLESHGRRRSLLSLDGILSSCEYLLSPIEH